MGDQQANRQYGNQKFGFAASCIQCNQKDFKSTFRSPFVTSYKIKIANFACSVLFILALNFKIPLE